MGSMSLEERFWSKVEKTEGCWNWKAAKNQGGYGVFGIDCHHRGSRLSLAHRVSYELLKGAIPETLTLDHLCRNHACVNPSHLEAVTQRENLLRGEGFPAIEAKRTHCWNGHLLEGNNLLASALRKGYRQCRICYNAWQRQNYKKRKER